MENDIYDFHLKTKRSVLNTYKLKWTIEDFSILPQSRIKSPIFNPLPNRNKECCIEIEISDDDLRVYLCFQEKEFFVNCDFSILDVNGLILYHKSTTSDSSERCDLTDATMRGCFPTFYSTKSDTLIFSFCLTIHGSAITTACNSDCDTVSQIDSLKKLSSDLLFAYLDSANTDVVLITRNGNVLGAHKAILSARSSVFSKMFEHDMEENSRMEVNITDISFDILKKLVKFLYCGELGDLDNQDSAYDLYYAADKYNVLDLRKLCGNVLTSKLTVDNACRTLARVDQHNDDFIKARVIQYICLHLKDVVNTSDWDTYMDNKLSGEVIKMSLM